MNSSPARKNIESFQNFDRSQEGKLKMGGILGMQMEAKAIASGDPNLADGSIGVVCVSISCLSG